MADALATHLVVQPLSRAVLDGVDDGTGTPMQVDLAVLPYFEDERPLQGLAGMVDWRMGGRISALVREDFCSGRGGEAVLLPGGSTLPMERIVLLGLGPSESFDRAAAVTAGGKLVDLVEGLDPREVLVAMPGRPPDRAIVEAVFDGIAGALTVMGPGPQTASPPTTSPDPVVRSVGPTLAAPPVAVSLEVAAAPAPPDRQPATDEPTRVPATPADRGPRARRWWVVADPRHEARLRRLLEGPPRAAETGA